MMNNTREELREAILEIADAYNLKKQYELLLKEKSLPEITKYIIVDMFENRFNHIHCGIGLYKAYTVIYEYRKELKNNGFVEFK